MLHSADECRACLFLKAFGFCTQAAVVASSSDCMEYVHVVLHEPDYSKAISQTRNCSWISHEQQLSNNVTLLTLL